LRVTYAFSDTDRIFYLKILGKRVKSENFSKNWVEKCCKRKIERKLQVGYFETDLPALAGSKATSSKQAQ